MAHHPPSLGKTLSIRLNNPNLNSVELKDKRNELNIEFIPHKTTYSIGYT